MAHASLPSPPTPARDREFRRLHILAMAPAGWSYAAIRRAESVSRERAPQIVADAALDAPQAVDS
jgi:hypothetical protein